MSAVVDEPGGSPTPTHRRASSLLLPIAAIVVADQLTKVWAVAQLSERDIDLIGSRVGFTLTRNSGAAFSSFQGATALLAVIASVVSVVLWRMARRATDRWILTGLVMVLAGALGNLVDRFVRSPGPLRGHVVDFIHVWPIPVFNIADACITLGAGLLIVRSLFMGDDDPGRIAPGPDEAGG